MRALLDHLIEVHHQRATPTGGGCPVCAHVASPECWQTLWLTYRYTPRDDFERRLMDGELVALGQYVAWLGRRTCDPANLVSAPHFMRRTENQAYLDELVASCPRTHTSSGNHSTNSVCSLPNHWG
jgi:hypothetical protein